MKRKLWIGAIITALLTIFSVCALFTGAAENKTAVPGDFDGNGKVTAKDARCVLRCAARLDAATDAQAALCDVDANGKLNASDARQVLRIAAKIRMEYDFNAQYVRAFDLKDAQEYPTVALLRSRADLEAFYEANTPSYYSGSVLKTDSELVDARSIQNACEKYDDAFFADRDIILIVNEESSGAYRDEIVRVTGCDGNIEIGLNRYVPGRGYGVTCDMAYWHIFVEVEKDVVPRKDVSRIDVLVQTVEGPDAPDYVYETEPTTAAEPSAEPTQVDPSTTVSPMTDARFEAQYIRTVRNKYDAPESPAVHLITSGAELEKYYNDNKEEFSFDESQFSSMPSFRDACEKYDWEFFDQSDLLIVFLEEGSGSIRHEVTGVAKTPEGWQVSILADSPWVQTCDMAYWQIPIALDKGLIADEKDVTVKLEGRLNYDFTASCVRTDWFEEDISLPAYSILGSRGELDAYIGRAKEILTVKNPDSDRVGEFVKACEKYDEKYFEWHDLVLLTMTEPSGSITHKVTGVFRSTDRKGLLAAVERTVPSPQTCDAAQWHILIELEKDIVSPEDYVAVQLSTVELTSEPAPDDTTVPPQTEQPTGQPTKPADGAVAFHSQMIRTNGWFDGAEYPIATVIGSRAELDDYYKKNKDRFTFDDAYGDDCTVSFRDACGKYDDAFFASHDIILVAIQEGSGSIRHRLTGVTAADGGLRIDIQSVCPYLCSADMAQWHLFVEVDKGIAPDADGIRVVSEKVVLTTGESMEAYFPAAG